MITSDKILMLIDKLQSELDTYIELHEDLAHEYALLLDQNEALLDKIAELTRETHGPDRN